MTTAGTVTLHVDIKFWRGDFGYGCIQGRENKRFYCYE